MRRTIAELTRACRARPEDTLLQVELARHLYRDGRSVEALTHLQVAIEAVAEPASLLSLLYEWTGRAVVRGPWPCPSGDPEGRRLSEACGPRRGFVEHRLRLGSGGSSRFKNPGGGAEYAVSATADQRSVYVSSQRGHVFCFDASSWNRVGEAPGRSGRASAPLLLPFGLPLITTDGCLTLYKQALAGELWRHDVEGPDAPLERLVTPPLALIGGLLMLKTARSLTLFDLSVGRARAQHSLTPTQRGVLRPAHGRLIGPAGAEGLDVRGLDGVLQRQLRWPREARLGPRPGLIVDPDRRLYVSSPARRPDR